MSRAERKITLIALVCLASVTFLGKSHEVLLRGIDSNIHAAASMGVTAGGKVVPELPIPMKNYTGANAGAATYLDPNAYFNDHPFFIFWLNGLFMRAFGPSAWSARVLTAFFSVGCVLLTYFLGVSFYAGAASGAFGVLAALFLIFSRDFILTSATMSLDTGMIFFILLTFLLWQKRAWPWLGIAAGVGLWVKTPVVLLVFPTALIVEAIQGKLKNSLRFLILSGAIAVGVGSLVWILTGVLGGWNVVADYWSRQLWGTAVGGRSGAGDSGLGYFFYSIRTGFLPGLPFLIVALIRVIGPKELLKRRWPKGWPGHSKEPAFLIPVVALAVLGGALTLMRFKMGSYYTPIFPFLALIAPYSVIHWVARYEARFYRAVIGLTLVLITFLLVTPTPLAPEAFVALKRFIPLIQTHGSCNDRIVLVPGGEPAGSSHDYNLALNFYTGRTVQVIECAGLSGYVGRERPEWIILSHENFKKCLNVNDRGAYPSTFLVGAQYLMSRQISRAEAIDLTPLEVELKAVTDCRAPAYPRDLWHRYVE